MKYTYYPWLGLDSRGGVPLSSTQKYLMNTRMVGNLMQVESKPQISWFKSWLSKHNNELAYEMSNFVDGPPYFEVNQVGR